MYSDRSTAVEDLEPSNGKLQPSFPLDSDQQITWVELSGTRVSWSSTSHREKYINIGPPHLTSSASEDLY